MSVMHRCRAFGIAAHVDAGKTTLSERMLLHTGRIHRAREVHHGGATTDPMAIERRRGISIQAAATDCTWREHQLTLVDTPGHIDFAVEVERSLRVLDGAVLVLCAVGGVQAQTHAVHRQLERHSIPFVAFINKCDRPGADPIGVIAQLRDRLGLQPVHISAQRIEDCAADLVDAVSLYDLELTRRALADDVTPTAVRHALRRVTLARQIVPVLTGSAIKDQGVDAVLDAVVDYLPSPADRIHHDADGAPLSLDADAPALALAFKRQETDHGPLTWVRVYEGTLRPGVRVRAVRSGTTLRIARVVRLNAGGTVATAQVGPGEIAALVGIGVESGDTLAGKGQVRVLPGIEVPAPVVEAAISLRAGSMSRLRTALTRLAAEDPTLHVATDNESGELRLRGMGELHLEVVVERLAEDHDVHVVLGAPTVALRRTIDQVVNFAYLHDKQNGGRGQYAGLTGHIEPIDDLGVEMVFEVGGDAVPKPYRNAIARAVEHLCTEGLRDDVPLVGLRVVITDGRTHSNDSSDLAFYLAMRGALVEALVDTIVLEPRMNVEVEAPSDHHGALLRTLMRRKAEVVDVDVQQLSRVTAEVPLASLFGYATELLSATHGTGSFSMEFSRYARR
jgi:elongation factor G